MDSKVRDYLEKQPSPQKEICTKVRQILLATLPDAEETFKNGVPWYGKFYIAGMKDSVNVGFSISGLKKEDLTLFRGQGKFMRHIKIHTVDDVNEAQLEKLFKQVWKEAICYE